MSYVSCLGSFVSHLGNYWALYLFVNGQLQRVRHRQDCWQLLTPSLKVSATWCAWLYCCKIELGHNHQGEKVALSPRK